MHSMEKMVADILAAKKINKVFFVACGGSLAAFYPAKYFLERESKTLVRIGWHPANEFVHDTPSVLDGESLVVICSHQGTTPETVEAGRMAKAAGAQIVAFTYAPDSVITTLSEYVVVYSWGEGQIYSQKKESLGLLLAMELLKQLEGWQGYEKALEGFAKYDAVVANAKEISGAPARTFACANAKEPVIYTVGCGASWGAAYMESICILLEMQWINSACIHSGEFFHGPLEITDENTPFLLFVGSGPCRELDDRVERFMEKYARKVYKLDAEALGIKVIDETVREYFCPLLLSAVVDVYNQALAETRNHPLSTRRYMWKVAY